MFEYYVYYVYVDDQLKYIGKGCNLRYKHALRGTSSVAYLNRDYFLNKKIRVELVYENLDECYAEMIEEALISYHSNIETGLYNKKIKHNDYASNCEGEDLHTYITDKTTMPVYVWMAKTLSKYFHKYEDDFSDSYGDCVKSDEELVEMARESVIKEADDIIKNLEDSITKWTLNNE